MLQRILKESVSYGVAGAASQFIGILLVPLFTRLLTPSDFGLLDIMLAVSAAIVLISGLQVESGVGRGFFEAQEAGQKRELIGTAMCLFVTGGLAFGALMLAGFWRVGDRFADIGWVHILPVVLSVVPAHVLTMTQIILRFERRIRLFVVLSVGDVLTSGILALLAITWLDYGVAGYLWALLISKVLWSVIAAGLIPELRAFYWSGSHAREVLTFSVPTVPSTLVGWAQTYGNRFVLVAFLSTFEVGIFSLAVKVASAAGMALMAFRLSWYTYSYEIMGKPGFQDSYARMLGYYWVGGFSMCAMLGAAGAVLVGIFAGEDYASAGRLVGFVVMGLLWDNVLLIIGLGIDYARKTYLTFIGFAIGTAVNLLGLYLTIEHWGIVAAGAAFLVGSIVTAVIILVLAQRELHVPYNYPGIALIAVLSIVFSCWFFFLPGATAPLGAMVRDAVVRCLVTGGICTILYFILISKRDRTELSQQARHLLAQARQAFSR